MFYERSCEADELGLAQCSESITAQPGPARGRAAQRTWYRDAHVHAHGADTRQDFSCEGLRPLTLILSIGQGLQKKPLVVPARLGSPRNQQRGHHRLACRQRAPPAQVLASGHAAGQHPRGRQQWFSAPRVCPDHQGARRPARSQQPARDGAGSTGMVRGGCQAPAGVPAGLSESELREGAQGTSHKASGPESF